MNRESIEALVRHLDGYGLPPVLKQKLDAVKAELEHDKLCEIRAYQEPVPWRNGAYGSEAKSSSPA